MSVHNMVMVPSIIGLACLLGCKTTNTSTSTPQSDSFQTRGVPRATGIPRSLPTFLAPSHCLSEELVPNRTATTETLSKFKMPIQKLEALESHMTAKVSEDNIMPNMESCYIESNAIVSTITVDPSPTLPGAYVVENCDSEPAGVTTADNRKITLILDLVSFEDLQNNCSSVALYAWP